MKSKKDIFDRFRENQHKLNEMPSPQAWRKLESRLDVHQNRSRSSLYRSLAMVAAVTTLVAVSFVVSLLMEQQQTNDAMAAYVPKELEVLDTYTDATEEAYTIVEFTRKHTSRLSNPVSDGHPGKKLKAAYELEELDHAAIVKASKSASEQKALMIKDKHFESFKKLLYAQDVQNFFAGSKMIFVFKTESLCNTIDCKNFQLEKTKQKVFFAAREDIFMYGDPNYMVIEKIQKADNDELTFKYSLKAKSK